MGKRYNSVVNDPNKTTEVDDGTPIASLMSCFTKKMVDNPRFPKISERVAELKTTEGGQNAVCAVMEVYEKKAREEGREVGREEGEGRYNDLISALIGKKRFDDIEKATQDIGFRKQLYKEFEIA